MGKKEKEVKAMTKAEYRATLPEKLNKLGEWLVAHHGEEPEVVIRDMRAVMR